MSQPSPLASPMPWNLVAPAYTEELVPSFEEFATDALRLAAAPLRSRIVDVACGPGSLAILAARAGHTVDALDFSTVMIEKLQARLAAENLASMVTPQVGDGQALPYADATFAAGFSMFGLMFFPDRATGFRELRRVLVPGARAVVSSWTPLDQTPAMAAMFTAIRVTLASLLGPDAPKPGQGEMPLSTPELCRAEMSSVFTDVAVHRVPHVQRYASAGAFWESVERTMAPLVLMRRSLGEERWPVVASAARDAITSVLGTGEAEVTMTALLSVGTAR